MNLAEIRAQLIELSGRTDLTTGNKTDWFINAGSRLLDGLIEKPDLETIKRTLAAGETMFAIRSLRYVQEVTRKNLTTGQDYLLAQASNWRVRSGKIFNGWSYAPSGSDPMKRGERPNVYFVPAGDGYSMGNIEVAPWTEPSELTIVGHFDSSGMSEETDTNYWSVVRPELLVKAALYQLEVFYRNREGAADWLAAIQLEAAGIDNDLAARSVSENMALGG